MTSVNNLIIQYHPLPEMKSPLEQRVWELILRKVTHSMTFRLSNRRDIFGTGNATLNFVGAPNRDFVILKTVDLEKIRESLNPKREALIE